MILNKKFFIKLIENFNKNEEEFEIEKIVPIINDNKNRSELHQNLLEGLYEFKGNKHLADDITMLTCIVNS